MSDLIYFEANGEQLWIGRQEVQLKSWFVGAHEHQLKFHRRSECNHLSKTYLTGLALRCYN